MNHVDGWCCSVLLLLLLFEFVGQPSLSRTGNPMERHNQHGHRRSEQDNLVSAGPTMIVERFPCIFSGQLACHGTKPGHSESTPPSSSLFGVLCGVLWCGCLLLCEFFAGSYAKKRVASIQKPITQLHHFQFWFCSFLLDPAKQEAIGASGLAFVAVARASPPVFCFPVVLFSFTLSLSFHVGIGRHENTQPYFCFTLHLFWVLMSVDSETDRDRQNQKQKQRNTHAHTHTDTETDTPVQ